MILRGFRGTCCAVLGLTCSSGLGTLAGIGEVDRLAADAACPSQPLVSALELTWDRLQAPNPQRARGSWGTAFEQLGAGNLLEARRLLQELAAQLSPACAEVSSVRLDLDLAALAYEAGDLEQAWRFARSARRRLAASSGDAPSLAASWLLQGEVALEWADFGLADAALTRAIAQATNDEHGGWLLSAATVRLSEVKERLGAMREARALARSALQVATSSRWGTIEAHAMRVLERTRAAEPNSASDALPTDPKPTGLSPSSLRDLELIVDETIRSRSPNSLVQLSEIATKLRHYAPRSLLLARTLGALLARQGPTVHPDEQQKRSIVWAVVHERCSAAIDALARRTCLDRHSSMVFELLVSIAQSHETALAFRLSQAWTRERRAAAHIGNWPFSPPCSADDLPVDTQRWRAASEALARARTEQRVVALDTETARRWGVSPDAEFALAAHRREVDADWRRALADWSSFRLDMVDPVASLAATEPTVSPFDETHDKSRSRFSGELLLTYVVDETRTLFFVVPPDPNGPISSHVLNHGRASWERMSLEFRAHLFTETVERSITVAERDTMVWWGRALRRGLLPANVVARLLRPTTRLLIEPDGPLWSVPFGALVLNDHGAPIWLGATARLTLIHGLGPPATSGGESTNLVARAGGVTIVGEAPKVDRRLRRSGRRGQRLGTPPAAATERRPHVDDLPGARVEVEALARLYGVKARAAPSETDINAIDDWRQAQIVHFATHGVFEPGPAALSYLTLGHQDSATDQRLEAWEISCLGHLQAHLVVLAACDSAPRGFAPLEAPGLSDAFLDSGARAVLAAMWPVADAATVEFMLSFHRSIKEGAPLDEALRRAVAERVADPFDRSPFRWAGFVLVGRA